MRLLIGLALGALLLTACEQQPKTENECVLKYAKPNMDPALARMAINACIDQIDKPSYRQTAPSADMIPPEHQSPPPSNEPRYTWDWTAPDTNVTETAPSRASPAPSPRLPFLLVLNLVPVMLFWAIVALIFRFISKQKITWILGILSFCGTWLVSALVNGAYGSSSPLLFLATPLVASILSLLPLLLSRTNMIDFSVSSDATGPQLGLPVTHRISISQGSNEYIYWYAQEPSAPSFDRGRHKDLVEYMHDKGRGLSLHKSVSFEIGKRKYQLERLADHEFVIRSLGSA